MNPVAQALSDYLNDLVRDPGHAALDPEKLPEDFREFGRNLCHFAGCTTEMRALAHALSRGDLDGAQPSPGNRIAGPLKALHAALKHFAWQTRQVAQGNYTHRVEFMGSFADAFNDMVEQLDRQRSALVEARLEAESANRAKSRFLAMISHEMRTPLNAVIGLSEIQLQNDLPENTVSDLEKIYASGSALLAIINDMLDISRIEAGGLELLPVEYDTPSLLNDAMQLNILRIGEKHIAFELDVDETFPAMLYGDELRIRQILNNLLSNAIKYTQKGRVRLSARWERRDGDAWLTFAVSDTGAGIREEDMTRLFSEYSRYDQKANRRIEGTGLGLSITKRLVEMMDGEIFAESEYGKGSTFTARIRQSIVDDRPIGEATARNLKSLRFKGDRRIRGKHLVRTWMPYGRVLVVDDVATNLDVARGLMAPYGLTVDCAASGPEAIEIVRLEAVRHDLVFMDHMMPNMDGVEATRIIRNEIGTEYAGSVPIVALTANAIAGNEEMFLRNGFNGFVSKPIDLLSLDTLLNRWVRDRHAAQTPRQYVLPCADVPDGRTIRRQYPEGFDAETGVDRYGSEDSWLQILRSYATHTPAPLARLRLVPEEALPEYAAVMHALKGSSYGACLNKAGLWAERLENAAKKVDFATIRSETCAFLEYMGKTLSELDALLRNENEAHGKKESRPAPDEALLARLLEACRHFRLSAMEEALTALERYEYESGGELVAWLRQQADALEYDAVRKRLEGRAVL